MAALRPPLVPLHIARLLIFVKIITAKQYFPISLLTTSKIVPSPISYDFPIGKHF
jgi:hypothetical protein